MVSPAGMVIPAFASDRRSDQSIANRVLDPIGRVIKVRPRFILTDGNRVMGTAGEANNAREEVHGGEEGHRQEDNGEEDNGQEGHREESQSHCKQGHGEEGHGETWPRRDAGQAYIKRTSLNGTGCLDPSAPRWQWEP